MPRVEFKVIKDVPQEKQIQYNEAIGKMSTHVEIDDLIKLANAVEKNRGLVKSALKWIK